MKSRTEMCQSVGECRLRDENVLNIESEKAKTCPTDSHTLTEELVPYTTKSTGRNDVTWLLTLFMPTTGLKGSLVGFGDRARVCPFMLPTLIEEWMSFNSHFKKLVWSTRIGRIFPIWIQMISYVEAPGYKYWELINNSGSPKWLTTLLRTWFTCAVLWTSDLLGLVHDPPVSWVSSLVSVFIV